MGMQFKDILYVCSTQTNKQFTRQKFNPNHITIVFLIVKFVQFLYNYPYQLNDDKRYRGISDVFHQLMNDCPFQAGSMHADIQPLFSPYVSCFAAGDNDLPHSNVNGITRLTQCFKLY